jgi:hypothetical protein
MVEEGRLPTDVAGVERTLAAYRGELAINHQGRETLRFLLRPNLSPAMRAGYYPLLGGALASLDAHERELLALSGLRAAAPVLRAQTRALLGLLRRATPTTPSHQAATGRIARRPPDSPVEAASSRRHRARSAAAARYPGSGW